MPRLKNVKPETIDDVIEEISPQKILSMMKLKIYLVMIILMKNQNE